MLVRLIVSGIKSTENAFFWTLTTVRQAPLTATLVPFCSLDKNLPVVEIVKVWFVLVMTLPRLVIMPVNILPFIPTVRSLKDFHLIVFFGLVEYYHRLGLAPNHERTFIVYHKKTRAERVFLKTYLSVGKIIYIKRFKFSQVVQTRSAIIEL